MFSCLTHLSVVQSLIEILVNDGLDEDCIPRVLVRLDALRLVRPPDLAVLSDRALGGFVIGDCPFVTTTSISTSVLGQSLLGIVAIVLDLFRDFTVVNLVFEKRSENNEEELVLTLSDFDRF